VLGGNVLFVSSGSAPISAEVIDFLTIALSCEVIEGRSTNFICSLPSDVG
jgi:long-chain acyl-CoA synthetase